MVAPKTISVADLTKITQDAVKKVAGTSRIVKGPLIWGYVLDEVRGAKQLSQATAITNEINAAAKAAGVKSFKAQPVVLTQPGKIIAGYIEQSLSHTIER